MADAGDLSNVTAIRLHARDNVLVAAGRIPAGQRLAAEGVTTREAIGSGHKIAARDIKAGEPVLKYGQSIGAATADIAAGAHVHVHNLAVSDLRLAAEPAPWAARSSFPKRRKSMGRSTCSMPARPRPRSRAGFARGWTGGSNTRPPTGRR